MAKTQKKRKKSFFTVKAIFAAVALAMNMVGRGLDLMSIYFENYDYIFNSQNGFNAKLEYLFDIAIRDVGNYIIFHATCAIFLLLIFYFGLEGLGRRRKRLIGMAFFLNALIEMVNSFGYYFYNSKTLTTSELLSGYFTSILTVGASVIIALYGFRKIKSRRLAIIASAALIFSSCNFALENFGGHTFLIMVSAAPALASICGIYVLIFVHFLREHKLDERLAKEAQEEALLLALDGADNPEPSFFDDFESTEEFDLTDEIIISDDTASLDEDETDGADRLDKLDDEAEGSDAEWTCDCGSTQATKFCPRCGRKRG